MISSLLLLAAVSSTNHDPLVQNFQNPPLAARPHTWWHWLNGNVTREGITADLEAMKQVGIGGAQMFTVDQGVPAGPAPYVGQKWRDLTTFAVKEAARLGIELCIHNGAGWSSSGGPWIQPQDAMQVIAWSNKRVTGPVLFDDQLPQPKAPQVESVVPYYRDIAVYAYPSPSEGDSAIRRDGFLERTGVNRADGLVPDSKPEPWGLSVPKSSLIDLSDHLDANGHLKWDVPEGNWTILRMGHVPTGVHNHPAPPEGDGLEVDKLSKEALDKHWAGMMAKVVKDAGSLSGKTLNNVLIDSYEVGGQNWTPKFRQEFQQRRGYDPLPWLPVVSGLTIDNHEKSERFLWDLRRTIADLFADNYFGHMAELCHKNGLLFSTEPYGNGNFDNIQSGSKADIPMAEFWLGGGTMETTKLASSIGHIYGRKLIGAESFTGDDVRGRWLEEPYALKALGDLAFCNGINRYIFHRYAMQPWLNLKPGMTMGPWGTHLERTQTWWNEAADWMKYITRCQYLLQEGRFVADACYFYGEEGPNDLRFGSALNPALPPGYDYDGCDVSTLKAMKVVNGRVVTPSGMSYAVLVLPDSRFMTPAVATKIWKLVVEGATVVGPKPDKSPSLVGYPECDTTLRSIVNSLWGTVTLGQSGHRAVGKGHVYWNSGLGEVLRGLTVKPDFTFLPHNYQTKIAYIHRRINNADVYFVSNQNNNNTHANLTFRIGGKVPELFHPETGVVQDAPAYETGTGATRIQLDFGPAESMFVVFRKPAPVRHLNGVSQMHAERSAPRVPVVVIDSARYHTADGRGVDVTAKVRELVRGGQFEVTASNSLFGDPVVNVVKVLTVEYRLSGKRVTQTVAENQVLDLVHVEHVPPFPPEFQVQKVTPRSLDLVAWKPSSYVVETASRSTSVVSITEQPKTIDLSHSWVVRFAPNLGAPNKADFGELKSWTSRPEFGIKYFSGSATYSKDFSVDNAFISNQRVIRLDLGHVKNFATVTLNGRRIATLWKPPFAVDVTPYVKAGSNHVEVKVTNLWVNRLIGDEHFPPDVEWQDGHLAKWPQWLLKGEPRPKTGRVTFATWHFWDKNSPLLESGMIGPVKLQSAKVVRVRF